MWHTVALFSSALTAMYLHHRMLKYNSLTNYSNFPGICMVTPFNVFYCKIYNLLQQDLFHKIPWSYWTSGKKRYAIRSIKYRNFTYFSVVEIFKKGTVSGETMPLHRFPHHEIYWNFGILRSDYCIYLSKKMKHSLI